MIVITGASDGLGLELAKLYSLAGKKVVNISRRESSHAQINICMSLTESENISRIVSTLSETEEPIESFIYCAGIFSQQGLGDITPEEVRRLMSVNIESAILLVSTLYERMIRDETDIVLVASTAGIAGYKNQAAYGSTKWAMRGLSKNLQVEFEGKPNRVISFCPGGFKSKLFEKATGITFVHDESWMSAEALAQLIKHILDLPKNIEVSEIVVNRKKLT